MKVLISGTIAKDKRADSGLDDIGDKLNSNRLVRMMVVGMVEFHAHTEVIGQPETVTVRFSAIEPLTGEDDLAARNLLDQARRARGVGSTELTLFDNPDPDSDNKGPWPGDADYFPPAAAAEPSEAAKTAEASETAPKPKRAPRKQRALTSVPDSKADDAA